MLDVSDVAVQYCNCSASVIPGTGKNATRNNNITRFSLDWDEKLELDLLKLTTKPENNSIRRSVPLCAVEGTVPFKGIYCVSPWH